MLNFRKDTWFFALIAAILVITSLFIPARIIHSGMYGDLLQWLGGAVMLEIDSGVWHEDLFGLLLFTAAIISIIFLLTISINTKRGIEYKWDWFIYLISGGILTIFTILYWFFEFDPANETIGFTSIGIFISGIISLVAFTIDKFSANREG